MTVHAGWGIEEDDEVFFLVEAILKASAKHKILVFIETHRATITQDIWRTVRITREFPEILSNGELQPLLLRSGISLWRLGGQDGFHAADLHPERIHAWPYRQSRLHAGPD
jgi:hypothetical protein